jgi:hypothetical protein
MLGFANLMLDCWLEVSCIRKVLRLANSINVFRSFLGPRANAELVPKFHVALHASHAALPRLLWQGPEAIVQYFTDPSSRQRRRYKIANL